MLELFLAVTLWIVAVQAGGWGVLWVLAVIVGVPVALVAGLNIWDWWRDA